MKSIKSFIYIGIFLFLVTELIDATSLQEYFKDSIKNCRHLLSEESKDLLENDQKSDNDEIQCFRACVMKDVGLMKDNKINLGKIKSMFEELAESDGSLNDAMDIMTDCKKEAEKEDNECKVSAAFSKCFYENVEFEDEEENDENSSSENTSEEN